MPSSGSPGSRGEKRRSSLLTLKRGPTSTFSPDHARVEAVERAHRRAADAAAEQVVDAAVAGADEALGGVAPSAPGSRGARSGSEIAMYGVSLS